MIDEESHLLDEVHRRLCQGEDVWQKRDPRSTSTDLMVWFNAKAANEEAFPFLEWFQVMEYGSINLRNISERLGSSHPISPEISQSVAVALLSNKKFEVREALVYYLLSRLSEGMEVTPELYDALLSQITRSENENFSKAVVKLILGATLQTHAYISQQLCSHPNCKYFSEELLQHLNKATEQDFLECLSFVNKIYERVDEFFFTNDLRVLVDILVRTLQDPPSEAAIELGLQCLLLLSCSKSFPALKGYRKQQCLEVIQQAAGLVPQLAPRCEQLKEAYT